MAKDIEEQLIGYKKVLIVTLPPDSQPFQAHQFTTNITQHVNLVVAKILQYRLDTMQANRPIYVLIEVLDAENT